MREQRPFRGAAFGASRNPASGVSNGNLDEICVIKPRLPAARIVLAVSFFFVRDSTSNERF